MRLEAKLGALRSDRRGGALIEFAVVFPLLMAMMLGLVDFGRMFYVRQSLEFATEEAARYYMLNPTVASSTVTTYLQGKMAGGMGSGITVSYADTPSCNGNNSVTCTLITARYTFSFATTYLGFSNTILTAKAQAVRVT
jgi:Flp pilus assembly protein TadG